MFRSNGLAVRLVVCAALHASAGTAFAQPAASGPAAEAVTITATPIPVFRQGDSTTRFGALHYEGGFSFTGSSRDVAGLSGLVVGEDGSRFLAITDYGSFVTGMIARDRHGVPIGLEAVKRMPILGVDGAALSGKRLADAEGLARRGDDVFVAFERTPRILGFRGFPAPARSRPRALAQPIPDGELRVNQGLEALAVSPATSSLEGGLVAIAEGSIDADGNLFAAIVDGPSPGLFKIRKDARWNVSDADFLPNGDLLILERRYEGLFGGLGMRLRRIDGPSIAPNARVDGPVIFEADLSEEIDNMEGLAVWQDDRGKTRLTLISDDNGSFLQKNLLLEFTLVGGKAAR